MDKIIENLLNEFINKTSYHFNLSFDDALAAVSQSNVANNLVASGIPDDKTYEQLFKELFEEISKGY